MGWVPARIQPGDRFVEDLGKLSRRVGILGVGDSPYEDDPPIFYEEDDPLVVHIDGRSYRLRELDGLLKPAQPQAKKGGSHPE